MAASHVNKRAEWHALDLHRNGNPGASKHFKAIAMARDRGQIVVVSNSMGLFGRVHFMIGVLEYILRRAMVRGRWGSANAQRYDKFTFWKKDRFSKGTFNSIDDGIDFLAIRHTLEQHDKLISAKASDVIPIADALLQASGDFTQHPVSEQMPMAVVDLFEVVQIDEQNREVAVARAIPLQQNRQLG
jgi:hypothetical protein